MKILIFLFFVSVAIVKASKYPPKDWWETGNFYQIYPRSFKDSDGDGVGDLKGIVEKLPYLKELGISGAWVSPIFKSPMVDFGYDTSDYYNIHYEFGTVEDLEELNRQARKLGIKIILDFVPNHTSDEHEWFIKSAANDPEYRDFYVWHPGRINNVTGERSPPSNWLSSFRYSAWEFHEQRQEYYLHQFAVKQPDLNYRNPAVVERMKGVLTYWLERGISGFRIDAVPFLFESEPDESGNYPDEPVSGKCADSLGWCYLNHIHTQDLPETFDMVYQWRAVLDEWTREKQDYTRIMLTEAYTTLENTVKYFGNETANGSFIPFNFEMMNKVARNATAKEFKEVIDWWLSALPSGKISNWVLGNHDNKRIASRYGVNRTDLLNIMLNTLPGIAVTYNGEEIGMTDVFIPWNDTVDPQACNTDPIIFDIWSRDPERTPFQWDNTKNAGFSNASKTWLPVAPDYQQNNVIAQEAAKKSHLKIYKKLLKLRKGDVLKYGNFEEYLYNDDVFIYTRNIEDESYIIILNFGKADYEINLQTVFVNIGNHAKVLVASIQSSLNEDDIVDIRNFQIPAEVGVVLTNKLN